MRMDLVCEGGGVKGIALVGAVDALEEAGYRANRVAGTSAGAVVGALVAAGVPAARRREIMAGLDYRRFRDAGWLDRVPLVGRLLSLLLEQGVYEGRHLQRWLSDRLEEVGVRTFGDLLCDDDGASDAGQRRSRLVVLASDVTAGRLRQLPDDYAEMGLPEPFSVRVADAVRASMSIPYFYEPVRLRLPGRRPTVLVDGGMLSNFPVAVFDRTDGRPPRWPTFGLKLSSRAAATAPRPCGSGPLALARAMVATMTSFYDRVHLSDPDVLRRTIFIDTFDVRSTDFDLDAATRERLYVSGRTAAQEFLATWDHDAYVSAHRRAGRAGAARESAPLPG